MNLFLIYFMCAGIFTWFQCRKYEHFTEYIETVKDEKDKEELENIEYQLNMLGYSIEGFYPFICLIALFFGFILLPLNICYKIYNFFNKG